MRGNCKNGDNCKYLHFEVPNFDQSKCFYFVTSECTRDNCERDHDENYRLKYMFDM